MVVEARQGPVVLAPHGLPDDDDVFEAHLVSAGPLEVRVEDVAQAQHPPFVVQHTVAPSAHVSDGIPGESSDMILF